jgi:signal transduction histidine kinase/putative methionine-R-sulfoxide reductase with GAF domain
VKGIRTEKQRSALGARRSAEAGPSPAESGEPSAERRSAATNGCIAAELESFHRVGRFLSSILDLNELLRAILEEALDAVGAMRGFVALVDHGTGELVVRFTAGSGWDEAKRHRRIKICDAPGHGITSYVAATGLPYVCDDVTLDPRYVMYFPDVRSELAVPLLDRHGRTIGVLNIEDERPHAFSPRDQQLLVVLASQASIAITMADYRAREAALIEVGNELSTISDTDELMRRVIHKTAELLRADDCSIFQLNAAGDCLILRASQGLLASRVGQFTYRMGEGLTGWVAQHAQPARTGDVRQDPRWRGLYPELPPEQIEACLAVPIRGREGLLGVLRAVRRKRAPDDAMPASFRNHFTEEDEALLTTLAGQVGAALLQQQLIDKLVQTERMAAWGEMSARSAHMIGNKAFAIKGHLNELEHVLASLGGRSSAADGLLPVDDAPIETLRDLTAQLHQGVFRLEEILQEFRDFVMATQLKTAEVSVGELLRDTVAEACAAARGVRLSLEVAPHLPRVMADASRLRRAFSELVENAVNHQAEGGELLISAQPMTPESRERLLSLGIGGNGGARLLDQAAVVVEFVDRGPGIPVENKAKLFMPFFTTRAKGMGLGLSIVKGIIDAHGGLIREVGRPGEGARFVILLPSGSA